MKPERFSQLIGAMVFALKRDATPSEVNEVFSRWDDAKRHLQAKADKLDEFDAAVDAINAGDLGPAKRLLAASKGGDV